MKLISDHVCRFSETVAFYASCQIAKSLADLMLGCKLEIRNKKGVFHTIFSNTFHFRVEISSKRAKNLIGTDFM